MTPAPPEPGPDGQGDMLDAPSPSKEAGVLLWAA